MSAVSSQLQKAALLYQQGNLPEAQRNFQDILKREPQNPAALHYLGVIAYGQNDYDQAAQLLSRVLTAQPGNVEALYMRGMALLALNQVAETINSFDRVLTLAPKDAELHYNLGVALHSRGKLEDAARYYKSALTLNPNFAEANCNLGSLLQDLGNLPVAVTCFERAIALNPNNPLFHYNLALALLRQGKAQEAVGYYDQALRLHPNSAEALNGRGTALVGLNRPDEGYASFAAALKINPSDPMLHFNASIALQRQGKFDQALIYCDQALALKPDFVEALTNRGSVLCGLGRLEEALASCDRALALRPGHAEALNNRGNALRELKRLDEALESYGLALVNQPNLAEIHWNEAFCRLLAGDYPKGFQKFEWRSRILTGIEFTRKFPQPLWLGEQDISGKTVLLHAEQGFGDTIQFCRYAPLVAQRGARVILEVQPALKSLLAGLKGVAEIYATGEPLPAFDFHCPLMSLPLALKTTVATLPADVPYLSAPAATAKWQAALPQTERPRVGLFWSTNPLLQKYRRKSIAPDQLAPLLDCGVTLTSLQKEYRPEDRAWLAGHPEVGEFSGDLQDFADTAALAGRMDVVVTIDTAVAHLAGALGLPVWILLPHIGVDWRWMLDRNDSPWYPTARLYRQPALDDWDSVIDRVALDLRALSDARP